MTSGQVVVFIIAVVGVNFGVLGQFCTPTTPYNVANPLTFPLTNATSTEGAQTATQLNCALSGVSDYITRKHNCLRSGVSPTATNMLKMQWNAEAAGQAKNWADQCKYAHNPQANRTTSMFACGQNIAMNTGAAYSWHKIVNLWYNEVNSYSYGGANGGAVNGAVVGHYTQIVWATTWQIGCAWKACSGFNFYVCNYCPAGNMQSSSGVTDKPYISGTSCGKCTGAACNGGKLCTNTCSYSNYYSNCQQLNTQYAICNAAPGSANYALRTKCNATCLCPGAIYSGSP